ncbi:hypothetical protein Tco_0918285, partial [Tanacetum coccineum]
HQTLLGLIEELDKRAKPVKDHDDIRGNKIFTPCISSNINSVNSAAIVPPYVAFAIIPNPGFCPILASGIGIRTVDCGIP